MMKRPFLKSGAALLQMLVNPRRLYMKYILKIVCITSLLGLFPCLNLLAAQGNERPYIDAYTSASSTKITLRDAAFDAAAKALQAGSSDLASAAEAKVAGYSAPKGLIGNVMSTNPDGSVGISTISEWVYIDVEGTDSVKLQLTEGQNALNLGEVGRRGTLFIPDATVDGKNVRYLVHLKVVSVDILKYSDEAYAAGKFNSHYSGKPGKKSQYTFTCDVLAIEEVTSSVKLGIKMP
jgi:hypothetical protein